MITANWSDFGVVPSEELTSQVEAGPILRVGDHVGIMESRDVSHPDRACLTAYRAGELPPHYADGRSYTVDNIWRRLVGYGVVREVARRTARRSHGIVKVEMGAAKPLGA